MMIDSNAAREEISPVSTKHPRFASVCRPCPRSVHIASLHLVSIRAPPALAMSPDFNGKIPGEFVVHVTD
jgi:hypothetical protein